MSDDREVTGSGAGGRAQEEGHLAPHATPDSSLPAASSAASSATASGGEPPEAPGTPPAAGAAFAQGGTGSTPPPYGPMAGYPGNPGYPGYGYPGFAAVPRRRRRPSGVVVAALVAALLAGGVGGGVGAWLVDRDGDSSSAGVGASSPPVDPASLGRAPTSVAGIAAQAVPGTVTIKTKGGAAGFGGQSSSGTGAGFVLDTAGHILTNNHVVSLAAEGGELSVTFSDGKTVPGRIVGRAEGYDLAVVKVEGVTGLKPLPLGDIGKVAVGDPVIAIGAPFGLDSTVTTGIVSARERPVASGDGQQVSYMNALQTDASINPGNSGGPLLNAAGEVIGVNSAIRSTGGGSSPFGQQEAGSIGLGFAIPINQARWVAETLIQTGKPVYAQLGVLPNPRYEGAGAQIMTSAQSGQTPVTEGGPADRAGLKAGDVVTRLGDRRIGSYEELFSEIWSHRPGEKVKVTYERDGAQHTVDVTLGERVGDQ